MKIKECKKIMKKCPKCGKVKHIHEFNRDKYSKDGRTSKCKYCRTHSYENICPICGKTFYGSHKTQIYCSKKCMGISNNTQIKFKCDYCGKEHSMYKSEYYKEGKLNHYCSNECRNKHRSILCSGENHPHYKKLEERKCIACGNTFLVKPSSKKKYCSKECYQKNLKGENNPHYSSIKVICTECGKEFYANKSRREKCSNLFCSAKCSATYYGKIHKGENHYNWNPNLSQEEREKSKGRNTSPENKKWRKEVFKRDDYTCICCGERGGELNAHHLNGYNWDIDNRTNISNGVTLCITCHKKFHKLFGNKDNTIEQFKEFLKMLNIIK